MSMETPETPWERKLLTDLATNYLKGQRRAARWRLFFGVLALIWVAVLCYRLIFVFGADDDTKKTDGAGHTAVITFSGLIDDSNNPTRKLLQGMEAAYEDPNTKAIVIDANSPGGSPVLSGIAFDEIRRLRKVYPKIPVYTAVQDACASGCYYMATATDKIFVNKASLVGSIGVVTSS
jgi:protease-4